MPFKTKLKYYGVWMQIEHGDVMGESPPFWEVEDRLKWEYWDDVT
jgi:acyl-CoA-binding protein